MREKERVYLAFLTLIISIGLFIFVMLNTINFDLIKVHILGNKMVSYLEKKDYANFYKNLSNQNLITLQEVEECQREIDVILGGIQKYSYIGNYVTENDMVECYEVYSSKYSNEKIRLTLLFKKVNKKYYVDEYKLLAENGDEILNNNIKQINLKLNENTKENMESEVMARKIIQAYNEDNYTYIYSVVNDRLKENRNENDFVEYMKKEKALYGNLSNIKYIGNEISKDKLEEKVNYYVDTKNGEKLYVEIWIRSKENQYLSGINFLGNKW